MKEQLNLSDPAELQAYSLVAVYSELIRLGRTRLSFEPTVSEEESHIFLAIEGEYMDLKKVPRDEYIDRLKGVGFKNPYFANHIAYLSHPLSTTIIYECPFSIGTDGRLSYLHHLPDSHNHDLNGYFMLVKFPDDFFSSPFNNSFKAIVFVEIEPGLATEEFDSFSPEEQRNLFRSLLSVEGLTGEFLVRTNPLHDPNQITSYFFKFPCAVCRVIQDESQEKYSPSYCYSRPLVLIPPQDNLCQYHAYRKPAFFLQIPPEKNPSSK